MKPRYILVGAVLCACTVLPVLAIWAYEAYLTRDLTAEIIARAPEKGNYSPSELTVLAGKRVRLRVRNVDTVTHGFAIPQLGVDAGEIKAGHVVVLDFTPEQPGLYDFYCTTWCGDYHLQMRGTLKVVE